MSIIKDLSETHDSLKALSLSLIIAPLWYLVIFLICKDFYNESDLIIKVVLSGTLSMISCFLISFSIHLINEIKDKNTQHDIIGSMGVSIVLLFLWKSFLIFLTYTTIFFFNKYLYFYWYCVIFFIPIIFIFVLSLIKHTKYNS